MEKREDREYYERILHESMRNQGGCGGPLLGIMAMVAFIVWMVWHV